MIENQQAFSKVKILLILVAIALLGFGGWYLWQRNNKSNDKTTTNTQTTSPKPTTNEPAPQPEEPNEGTIKGNASYPSEFIPEDEEVCAQDATDSAKKPICVNVGKNETLAYELKVPPGDYYVYAQTSRQPGYKAYYNEFSKCGNSVNCPDSGHTKYIKVTVAKGATVENVDPSDWYAQLEG